MKRILLVAALVLLCAAPSWGFGFGFGFGTWFGGKARAQWVDLVQSLSWSTTTYDFGSHDVGTTDAATFTITNSGNDTAEEVATTVIGAAFSLYSTTTFGNISAGKARPVKVKFTPGEGLNEGFINYSAPNIARVSVALSGTGVAVVGACSSGTANVQQLVSAGGSQPLMSATNAKGNSFQVTQDGTLYSIVVHTKTGGGTSMTCRVGTSNDLTTYLDSGSIGAFTSAPTDHEILFSGHPALTAGTTYYYGCVADTANAYMDNNNLNPYASGGAYQSGTGGWSMGVTAGYDMKFEVKLCNP